MSVLIVLLIACVGATVVGGILLSLLAAVIHASWPAIAFLGFTGFLILLASFGTYVAVERRVEFPAHPVAVQNAAIVSPDREVEEQISEVHEGSSLVPGLRPPAVPAPQLIAAADPETAIPSLQKTYQQVVRNHEGTIVGTTNTSAAPSWVTVKESSDMDQNFQTLHSQQFATQEEAREQLWERVQSRLAQKLRERQKFFKDDWLPEFTPQAAAYVIQQECVEKIPLQVGEFEEHVYRVHWQARLDDETCQRLFALSTPGIVRSRLRRIAAFFGVTLLALATGAVLFRRGAAPTT